LKPLAGEPVGLFQSRFEHDAEIHVKALPVGDLYSKEMAK